MSKLQAIGLLLVVALGLGGCGNGEADNGSESGSASETELTLDAKGPANLTDTTEWIKFAFTTFSLKLPKGWRVSQVSQNQENVELINFHQVGEFDPANKKGEMKIEVSTSRSGSLDDMRQENEDGFEVLLSDDIEYRKNRTNEGVEVLIKPRDRERFYRFKFALNMKTSSEFAELILSTISFYQWETVSAVPQMN